MATALMAVGTIVSVIGSIKQGNEAERIAESNALATRNVGEANAGARELEAVQLERQANQERASAQRVAIEERRQKRLYISRAIAVAGASGGGVFTDISVINDIGKIGGVGEYNATTALWEGNEAALGLEDQAHMKRYQANIGRYESGQRANILISEGKAAKTASRYGALSTAIRGGVSIYDRYKKDKPVPSTGTKYR